MDKEKIFAEWEEIASNTGEDKPSSIGKKTIQACGDVKLMILKMGEMTFTLLKQ